ncbi:Rossmann-fold NAD(P)-binding domain-containing protein [Carboxylicivirga marina]|uniref:Uncharacterized protein n=1 Tax=Carboxylicivirga marina TaxID=2800988 RepID=A0ABS1HPB3_9BACT|nr:hypothetical protein [Carboxylicivirga marina]MBK3519509.1 hypothetical protein [Carboxylicivirga marina]
MIFFIGEVTKPASIKGVANGVNYVFSIIGITRPKDGMTYMDVDNKANLNLLNDALPKTYGPTEFF